MMISGPGTYVCGQRSKPYILNPRLDALDNHHSRNTQIQSCKSARPLRCSGPPPPPLRRSLGSVSKRLCRPDTCCGEIHAPPDIQTQPQRAAAASCCAASCMPHAQDAPMQRCRDSETRSPFRFLWLGDVRVCKERNGMDQARQNAGGGGGLGLAHARNKRRWRHVRPRMEVGG
jgi:hypothetical protein